MGCLEAGRIPSSAGFTTLDPDVSVSPVSQPMTLTSNIAVSESLAFGGHNSALVFGKENE